MLKLENHLIQMIPDGNLYLITIQKNLMIIPVILARILKLLMQLIQQKLNHHLEDGTIFLIQESSRLMKQLFFHKKLIFHPTKEFNDVKFICKKTQQYIFFSQTDENFMDDLL